MEIIGDYEYNKKDLIGHGAFAVVFKGRKRKQPNVPVAVKSITKKNLAKSQNLLSKEIKILKELADLQHENVVGLLDCKETANHVYLVMEYCNGGDLADYLQAKGTLSEDTLSVFLRQIAGAMRALYAKGIVHRDLKPQNILLCHTGKSNPPPSEMKLKIADFGFARFLVDGVMAATLCGSPMYMAPEVIMSLQYGAKADLWSIGTIVFQCLTGKAPFQAQTPQQLKQFYERNAELSPNIPPQTSAALKDLLLKLLKRNAKDRIDFESFFNHPFLKPKTTVTPSSPVPVPCRNNSFSSNQSSPVVKAISASPLSGDLADSNKKRDSYKQIVEDDLNDRSIVASQHEDFVMVPHSVPSTDIARGKNHSTSPDDRQAVYLDEMANTVTYSDSSHKQFTNEATQHVGTYPAESSQPITVPSLGVVNKSQNMDLQIKSDGQSIPTDLDLGSLSPPAVQFTIGTPPSHTWRRPSTGTPPSGRSSAQLTTTSAHHKSGSLSPLNFSGPGSLPTIIGSPAAVTGQFNYPVPSEPSPPLRTNTAPTFPSNVVAISPTNRPNRVHRCDTDPGTYSPYRRPSNEQLYHTPFHANQYNCGIVAYGSPQANTAQTGSLPRNRSFERECSVTYPGNRTSPYSSSPTHSCLYAQSPPNMEGPIAFNVPGLQEETLMDDHHNEILSKLSFVLDLVECIMELAQLRGMSMSSFSESVSAKQDERFNEPQRKLEQLMLYVRALQLLSKSLQLAKEEAKVSLIQPSNSFKTIARTMNEHYHRCLSMCKQLHKQGILSQQRGSLTPHVFSTTANKLLYNYAIELCQTAALDEFFGNPEQCFRRYTTAQILLHSLSQQAHDVNDKELLIKYREGVEKRLYNLQLQGNMHHIHHYDFYS